MQDISTLSSSMYGLNIQIRIIDILILSVIWFSYLKNKRMPFQSGKFFTFVLGCISINMVFDVITLYGVFHESVVYTQFNRVMHVLFMQTICIAIYGLYMHLLSLCGKNYLFMDASMVLRALPIFISCICVIFAPVKFHMGIDGAYSYGPMVMITYGTIAIYSVSSVLCVISYGRKLSRESFLYIIAGLLVWVGFSIVQLINPAILLSGTGMVVMILVNYFGFEDPKVYINYENGCFNSVAYRKMIKNYFRSNKNFDVCKITFREFDVVHGKYGHELCQEILVNIANIVDRELGESVYAVEEESLGLIILDDENVKSRIRKLVDLIEYDYIINENVIHITGVIDLVECPREACNILELEDIFAFMKKYTDRDSKFYCVDSNVLEEKRKYSLIVQILNHAISNDGFQMAYQPIYSTVDHNFHSAEALIRLKDLSTMGFISPETFIPIAEKEGMIMQIGEIVLSKVCEFANKERLIDKGIEYIEVNLSGIQCIDQGTPDIIRRITQKYNLPCSFLNLEITETAAVSSGKMLNRNIDRLKQMGATFSMDDFGTGYSNLAQMADTPYELIKIDKSLIWYCYPEQRSLLKAQEDDIENGTDKSRSVLTKVIELINELNLRIVAEGVETLEMVDMLTANGVEYLQGYYYSKPLFEKDYLQFIEHYNSL